MRVNKFIKEVITIVMLVVFTISITPKKYLHDIFFEHGDELFSSTQTSEKQINNFEFSCGFVNVVAVTPFVSSIDDCNFLKRDFSNFFETITEKSWWHLSQLPFSLRGPPVA